MQRLDAVGIVCPCRSNKYIVLHRVLHFNIEPSVTILTTICSLKTCSRLMHVKAQSDHRQQITFLLTTFQARLRQFSVELQGSEVLS